MIFEKVFHWMWSKAALMKGQERWGVFGRSVALYGPIAVLFALLTMAGTPVFALELSPAQAALYTTPHNTAVLLEKATKVEWVVDLATRLRAAAGRHDRREMGYGRLG